MPRLSRNVAITARWDETSFIDAATRNRPRLTATAESISLWVAGGVDDVRTRARQWIEPPQLR